MRCHKLRWVDLALLGKFILDILFIFVESAVQKIQDLSFQLLVAACEVFVNLTDG